MDNQYVLKVLNDLRTAEIDSVVPQSDIVWALDRCECMVEAWIKLKDLMPQLISFESIDGRELLLVSDLVEFMSENGVIDHESKV